MTSLTDASPLQNECEQSKGEVDRRVFVQTLAGALAALTAGCGGADTTPANSPTPATDTGTTATDAAEVDSAQVASDAATAATDTPAPDTTWPTPTCMETETNIEGPFYRAGAPPRADLTTGVSGGVPLLIRGRVYGVGCATTLKDAIVDVWQADSGGAYDNDTTQFRLRGLVKVDANGYYEVRTIIPGHYLNGSQYRPAHVHVKVSAAGHRLLTTQLYFEGDPYNGIDPFIKKPLIMKLENDGAGKRAWFDFVLRVV